MSEKIDTVSLRRPKIGNEYCGEDSESTLNDLLSVGQIKIGDTLNITYRGDRLAYYVEDIIDHGTDREEIILNIDSNLYFITSMAIEGNSWAKNVQIVGR